MCVVAQDSPPLHYKQTNNKNVRSQRHNQLKQASTSNGLEKRRLKPSEELKSRTITIIFQMTKNL